MITTEITADMNAKLPHIHGEQQQGILIPLIITDVGGIDARGIPTVMVAVQDGAEQFGIGFTVVPYDQICVCRQP